MPKTRYAKSNEVNIAYQVIGDGHRNLVYVPGWVTNIEVMWEEPGLARFLRRLASFSRLITFDKRGIGLSDPVPIGELPDLETRVEDMRQASSHTKRRDGLRTRVLLRVFTVALN